MRLPVRNSSHSPRPKIRGSPGSKPRSSPSSSPFLQPVGSNSSVSQQSLPVAFEPPKPVKQSFRFESPPLVLYGSHTESTGALLSGIFDLEVVQDDPFPMQSVFMAVYQDVKISTHAPSAHHHGASASASDPLQKDVKNHVTELARWDVLAHPADLPKRVHGYPFSYLVPGSLPSTASSLLFEITYYIKAVATPQQGHGAPYEIIHPLQIKRSIIPGPQRTSVRIFPPTDLTATMNLPPVIHPSSTFPIELRLEGICGNSATARWRMRKINWRVDETVKVDPSPTSAEQTDRGKAKDKDKIIEDVRVLASGEIKGGWKTDFSGKGKIELEFHDVSTHSSHPACCNLDDPTLGLVVTHALIMELVISEEALPHKSARHSVPTGAARVLRMQFNIMVTDHSGLGISWDEEVPPVYADVPLSPPDYDMVSELPKFEEVPAHSSSFPGINSTLSLYSPSLMSTVSRASSDSSVST